MRARKRAKSMYANNVYKQHLVSLQPHSVCIIYISGKCTHFMSSRSALVLANTEINGNIDHHSVLDFHLLPHLNLNTFNPKSLIFIYYKLPTYTQSIQLFQSFLLSLLYNTYTNTHKKISRVQYFL